MLDILRRHGMNHTLSKQYIYLSFLENEENKQFPRAVT